MNFLNSLLVFLLFFSHLLCFFFSYVSVSLGSFFFSFNLMEVFGLNLSLIFLFDFFSLSFCMVVCLITMVVLGYSMFYMGVLFSSRFVYLVFFFSLFMMILIFSGNFFLLMLGWDGLGVISFALVIYYQNEISVKSGLITIFINRFGDAAMIFFICLIFPFFEGFYFIDFDYFISFNIGVFLFVLACFTKSAQYPFMSWLPLAMTAPTPVSSLVHSSTLVTAGVYLIIRFNLFLFDYFFFSFVSFLGLFTMGIGGMLAIMEFDFKKIVAFSTLSQLGLLIFILSFGEVSMCFFHLLSHAVFKSFLFMMCGIFMSYSYGGQDGRIFGLKFLGSGLFQIMIMFSCLNLMGFPLTMGFLSSDLVIESFSNGELSFLYCFVFFVFCGFTVCYSFKLFFSIIFSMSLGFPIFSGDFFLGGKVFLLFLFFYMFLGGLGLEEFLIEDDLFSLTQDYKFVDVLIFLFGVFLYFSVDFLFNFNYFIIDYFWVSIYLSFLGNFIYRIGLLLNFNLAYYLDYFFVKSYYPVFLSSYSLFIYNKDFYAYWYILFLVLFFLFLY